ncbi:MAG: hypothetical protein JXA57_19350 [Armatimonadetes bacterium]|nr:hypothetical protein [Armatimonadota bacterium]
MSGESSGSRRAREAAVRIAGNVLSGLARRRLIPHRSTVGQSSQSETWIVRAEHERNYTMIANSTINDSTIDLQAKGLLVILLAKPDNWRVRPKALAREVKESRATVYRILTRLIAAGYVYREILRRRESGTGRYQTATVYIVFESRDRRREWIDRGRSNYEGTRGNAASQN